VKITTAQLFEYRLRLKQPVGPADAPLADRCGLLVKLTGETGFAAWGEAAPLPYFSPETLTEVRLQLASTLQLLKGQAIPPGVEMLEGAFEDWLGGFGLSASSRCALEVAVLNLIATNRNLLLASLLSPGCSEEVPVNGLITSTGDSAIKRARFLIEQGYRTLKLKVGRGDLSEDIETVRNISDILNDEAALRLDANRTWKIEDALEFAQGIRGCRIEYIEEPLSDSALLREFSKEANLPIALDESTREIEPDQLDALDFVAAVVLKPTLLGGFERAAAIARAASKHSTKIVISSSFESPTGIAALAHFAIAYGTEKIAAGLETVTWFEQQIQATPVSLFEGKLNLLQVSQVAGTIDESLLTEIDIAGNAEGRP